MCYRHGIVFGTHAAMPAVLQVRCLRVFVCVCAFVYIHAHAHANLHMSCVCVHTHTHAHAYTHASVHAFKFKQNKHVLSLKSLHIYAGCFFHEIQVQPLASKQGSKAANRAEDTRGRQTTRARITALFG